MALMKIRAFFMPYTYILYSEKIDRFYVGACLDINDRLYQHNAGRSTFTKTGIPWSIVYKEKFDNLREAKTRELEIKKKKSRKYIERLIENYLKTRS